MTNLLESLLQSAITVDDKKKRLTITKRPYPTKPRDLFELFAAMGRTASIEGLVRGIDLRTADPRTAYSAVLGRWPTPEELAALPTPYKPAQHLRHLVMSEEFRAGVAARLFTAFPEKRRLLFVRLPRCAGEATLDALRTHHPLIPTGLGEAPFRDPARFVPIVGTLGAVFETTSTLAVALPGLAPFVTSSAPPAKPGGGDLLRWTNGEPACRATDLLFTVLRPPRDMALSRINAVLAALRAGDMDAIASDVRARIGSLPPAGNTGAWRALGLALLADLIAPNPICHALADGTAAGAVAACACVPIQLVGLARYDEWVRVALGPMEAPRRVNAAPILRADDLTPQAREALDGLTAEDRDFYYRFESKLSAGALPAVAGHALE